MQIKFATISQSLFRKYLMLLVTLLSVVLIATAAINIYSSFRANKEALLGLQINEALSASEKIGQFITEVVRQIQLTTEKIQLIKEVQQSAGSEEVSSEFFRLLRQVPAVTRVSYLDSSGREQLRVSRLDLDVIGSQQDLSEDPKFVEAKSRGIYFGPVYFREESEPYIIIAVAGSDADTGVTVAELNLKLIWDVVSRIEIGKAGYAYVVDPQGTLVAHPNISLVLRKTNYNSLLQFRAAQASRTKPVQGETVTIAENLEGRQVLTAYATVPPLDWLVFVELPTAEAYAPLYALIWRSGLLLLGGLALAFLASLFLARKMVVPIRALREGAARIGSGDLGQRISVKTGDEFEALADQFNDMASRLEDSYANLENKVEVRTAELAQSVRELRALGEISQAVNSTLDLETVLTTIVAKAVQLSRADAGTIYVFDEASQEFRLRASYGMDEALITAIKGQHIHMGETVIAQAVLRRTPVQLPDVQHDSSSLVLDVILRAGFRALLTVPLLSVDRIVGALVVRRKEPGKFSHGTVDVLETFADQSVLAIQNARLFREIEEKGRELEIASQHKSQFLANMSHELRTPLNAILGYTELMAEGTYGELYEEMLEVLKRLETNGRHLLGLINDVLDLSKIEAGQLVLELSDYCIQDIAQTVRSTLEPLAADKKLAFKVEVPAELPPGRGDGRRLTQVLINLVGNAIKFTDAGEVAIKTEANNGSFYVTVRDTGPGISAADQAKLFQEFQQADNAIARKKGGTGLGLAISKRIIEMHGGRIWVESQPGHGSTFAFTLPVTVERQVGTS